MLVTAPQGTERVTPAFPSLEGRKLIDQRDLKGVPVIRDQIDAAMKAGRARLELSW